jgi:hypothetical protein
MCQFRFLYNLLRGAPWHQVGHNASVEREKRLEGTGGLETREIDTSETKASFRESIGRPVRIWIDTICVPLAKPTREIAIANMKKIYSAATMIIVLDAELMELEYKKCSEGEILLRIALSGWMRRCWTYQEAIIGGGIMRVCFKDGFYDLPDVVGFMRQRNDIAKNYQAPKPIDTSIAIFGFASALQVRGIVKRARQKGHISKSDLPSIDFQDGHFAIQQGTKRYKDAEPLYNRYRRNQAQKLAQEMPLSPSDGLTSEVRIFFSTMSALWSPQPEPGSADYIQDRVTRIAAAWRGLQHRSSTRHTDRFINFAFACAKSKADFAVLDKILERPATERLQAWLAQQPAVPSGLLFTRGLKMELPGNRWAPADIWPTDINSTDPARCITEDRGEARRLAVRRSGFVLAPVDQIADAFHFVEKDGKARYEVWIDRDTVPANTVRGRPFVFNGTAGLVLEESGRQSAGSAGVLLNDVQRMQETNSGVFVCRVEVNRIEGTASKASPAIRGVRTSDEQNWLIS